jgi:hypothetical protein
MKVFLSGYGKMGRMLEELALERGWDILLEKPIVTDEAYRMNFTNEGGIDGTTRFLKNITGMWILEQCMKEWKKDGITYAYEKIVQMADTVVPSTPPSLVKLYL